MTEERKECKICSLKPKFLCSLIPSFCGKEYDFNKSTVVIADGFYTELRAGKDKNDKVAMYGTGEDCTEPYYPKYCPECGRKLQ